MEDEAAKEDFDAEEVGDIGATAESDEETAEEATNQVSSGESKSLDLILDIPLTVAVELGRSKMLINDLLQ